MSDNKILESLIEPEPKAIKNRINSFSKNINSDTFMEMILDDMSWNSPAIKEIEGGILVCPQNSMLDIGATQTVSYHLNNCYKYFLYECMDGQSVRKDLLKVCQNYGYRVKVMVLSNAYRNCTHQYLIGIKNPLTLKELYKAATVNAVPIIK